MKSILLIPSLLIVACGRSSNPRESPATPPSPTSDTGGSLKMDILRVSRNECTSPCPVIFSKASTRISVQSIEQAFPASSITLRPEGYFAADMLLAGIRRSSADADGGRANIYEDRYASIRDVYLGTPDSINNAARISIATTRPTAWRLKQKLF